MIDKLEWNNNAFELMKYIGIIEDIYMPDFDNYEYRINVSLCEASKEAIKEASNRISVSYTHLTLPTTERV